MSGQFHERDWQHRFTKLGDQAEGVFDAVYPKGSTPFGLNRPPIRLSSVPARIRHTPDRLTSDGLVECQGFGRDQLLKVKFEKYDCLRWWDTVFPTRIFVWDSKHKRYGYISLKKIGKLLDAGAVEFGTFHEGKAYIGIHADEIDWQGTYDPKADDA